MNKTIKIYIVFLVLIFIAIIFVDANRPRPIDWRPTYSINDKIPFGLYIFDKETPTLLKKNSLKKVTNTIYEYFEPLYNYDSLVNNYSERGTILSISEYSQIDDQSTQELLYFVSHGNSAYLSSKSFSKILMDSLKFETNNEMIFNKEIKFSLANKKLDTKKYNFDIGAGSYYFGKIDTLTTTILGYQESGNNKFANFIKVPHGNGFFYLHTQPAAFTNYHILKENHSEYLEKIVSYIPKGKIFWAIDNINGESVSSSPMRFILSNPALKWAWYLFLIGMVFFMIFNAKRKQRIVPIVKPLQNTTVDFTKTIGNLYYQEGDHQNIINKKIIYFLERVRNEFLIETNTLDENFIKKLHLKTGKNIEDIENVVRLINYQRRSYHQSIEDDLIEINNAIEKIFS
ncbi:DUF4350 domain-containing protein [Flavobacterium sp.]|uniref:DUF4350 domain-containing protein n=1 Tax=Flavobacterium sp. TaxID=239 RepID=UPI0026283280|nr:DUF4350 domain-containing protein [Flavobacterium sp.]